MRRTVESRFYPELEGLRGIASLSVLFGHCYLHAFPTANYLGPGRAWLHTLIGGVFNPQPAVLLFFVLSGFVLGCQLEKTPVRGPQDYAGYLLRRLFRLLPATWVSLVLALAIAYGLGIGNLRQFLMAAVLWDFTLNIVIWTMYIEMTGSILMPFMAQVAGRGGALLSAALFGLLLLACIFLQQPLALPFMVFFYAGLLIAYVPRGFILRMQGPLGLAAGVLAIVLYVWSPEIAAGAARDWMYWRWNNWMWLEIPACVLLVYLVAQRRFAGVSKLLDTAGVRFLGRISFSLYLLHYPVLQFVTIKLAQWGYSPAQAISIGERTLMFGVKAGLVLGLSVPLAWLSYRYVERPGIDLGRRLAGALAARPRLA